MSDAAAGRALRQGEGQGEIGSPRPGGSAPPRQPAGKQTPPPNGTGTPGLRGEGRHPEQPLSPVGVSGQPPPPPRSKEPGADRGTETARPCPVLGTGSAMSCPWPCLAPGQPSPTPAAALGLAMSHGNWETRESKGCKTGASGADDTHPQPTGNQGPRLLGQSCC